MIKYAGRKISIKHGLRIILNNPGYIGRVFWNIFRTKAQLDYKWGKGYSFYPSTIVWEITNRCNLKCKMCWLYGVEGIGNKFLTRELSTSQVQKIIDEISIFRPLVYLTGGEPFIRKDLIQIVKRIKKKGCLLTVSTNGTLISGKISRELVISRVDAISFSLDGPAAVHDKIRGSGTFKKTVKGIEMLRKAKKQKKSSLPILKVSFTITDNNYRYLTEFITLVEELGIEEVQIQHPWFITQERAQLHAQCMEKLFAIKCNGIYGYVNDTIQNIDLNKLIKEINKIKNRKSSLNIIFYPYFNSQEEVKEYYTDLNFTLLKRCINPWFSATIKPDGTLCPCPDYYIPEYIYGNLKVASFKNLWNNKKAIHFRNVLRKYGLFPGCSRCCGLFGR